MSSGEKNINVDLEVMNIEKEDDVVKNNNLHSEGKEKKTKRNHKEKMVCNSLDIINKYLNQEEEEINAKELIKISETLQKEINKNIEVEMMIKLNKEISIITEQFSSFKEKDRKHKFLKMKDDFLELKKLIDDKKAGLKRKCNLDDKQTPAKKLKNKNKINEKSEMKKEDEIVEISLNMNKDNFNHEKPYPDQVKTESPKKEDDLKANEIIKLTSKHTKLDQNAPITNKNENAKEKQKTLFNFFTAKNESISQNSKNTNNCSKTATNSIPLQIVNNGISETYAYPFYSIIMKSEFYQLPINYNLNQGRLRNVLCSYFKTVSKYTKKEIVNSSIHNKKLIFFQGSYVSVKNLEKKSNIIKPRKPFSRDDYLIDYDKDSEEEDAEENGEDLKSNDGDEEEEEKEENDEDDQNKWIVPDGYLSENEVMNSDIEEVESYNKVDKDLVEKGKNIFEIMDIRKTYHKPIIINFKSMDQDEKVKNLSNYVRAKVFNYGSTKVSFPIKVLTKTQANELSNKDNSFGLNEIIIQNIKKFFEVIHGNFSPKECLVESIHKDFPQLSKNKINDFFYRFTEKLKNEVNAKVKKILFKKRWMIKSEIIEYFKLNIQEINKMIENNAAKFIDKEKEDKQKKKNRDTNYDIIEIKCSSQPIEKEIYQGELPQTEIKKKKIKKAKESLNQSNDNSNMKRKNTSKKSKSKLATVSKQQKIPFLLDKK